MVNKEQQELWIDQREANTETRRILGIGTDGVIIGDLPDEAFNYAIAEGLAESLKALDDEYGLEYWCREIDTLSGLLYFCRKCGRNHYYAGSEIGRKHLKHQVHWAERALRDRQFYQKMYRESTLLGGMT